jgi:hypothetical protein
MKNFSNLRFFGKNLNRFVVLTLALTFGVVVTTFLVSSCTKEGKPTLTEGEVSSTLVPSCDDYCSECNSGHCDPKSVLEAVNTPDDQENDRVNMILYHYAKAVKEAAKNPTYRAYMLNAMTVNNQGVSPSLLTLANGNTAFATFLNDKIRSSVSAETVYPKGVEPGIATLVNDVNWDANAYLKSKLTYKGQSYDPVIHYIAKPLTSSISFDATVLIAQEVNDCDDIAGWKGDTEVLVGQAEASQNTRAVFIVEPGYNGAVSQGIAPPPTDIVSERTTTVNMSSFVINGESYRYEANGKSDIAGFWQSYTPSPAFMALASNGSAFWKKVKCKDIKDAKTITDATTIFAATAATPWDGGNFFIGFYEYDWYAQWKKIDAPCESMISVGGNMKFSNEWYCREFCGPSTSYWSTLTPGGATISRANNKCTFTLSAF